MKPLRLASSCPAARVCTTLLVAVGLGGCAVTRIPPASDPQTNTLFRQMDTDHDGRLSRAEFGAGFADAVLATYNQPRTGSVTSEQWNRLQNANNPNARSAFVELDTNGDGKLTEAELSRGPQRDAVVNRFFNLIDKNHDGFISLDEGRPSGLDRTPQQRSEGEGL